MVRAKLHPHPPVLLGTCAPFLLSLSLTHTQAHSQTHPHRSTQFTWPSLSLSLLLSLSHLLSFTQTAFLSFSLFHKRFIPLIHTPTPSLSLSLCRTVAKSVCVCYLELLACRCIDLGADRLTDRQILSVTGGLSGIRQEGRQVERLADKQIDR
jgi:hypothetical protein